MQAATRNADPLLAGVPTVTVFRRGDTNWRVSVRFDGYDVFTTTFSRIRPTPKQVERYVRWVADQITEKGK